MRTMRCVLVALVAGVSWLLTADAALQSVPGDGWSTFDDDWFEGRDSTPSVHIGRALKQSPTSLPSAPASPSPAPQLPSPAPPTNPPTATQSPPVLPSPLAASPVVAAPVVSFNTTFTRYAVAGRPQAEVNRIVDATNAAVQDYLGETLSLVSPSQYDGGDGRLWVNIQVAFQNSNSAAAQKDASNFANVVASNTAAVFASAPNLLSAGGLQTVSVRLQGRSIPVTTPPPPPPPPAPKKKKSLKWLYGLVGGFVGLFIIGVGGAAWLCIFARRRERLQDVERLEPLENGETMKKGNMDMGFLRQVDFSGQEPRAEMLEALPPLQPLGATATGPAPHAPHGSGRIGGPGLIMPHPAGIEYQADEDQHGEADLSGNASENPQQGADGAGLSDSGTPRASGGAAPSRGTGGPQATAGASSRQPGATGQWRWGYRLKRISDTMRSGSLPRRGSALMQSQQLPLEEPELQDANPLFGSSNKLGASLASGAPVSVNATSTAGRGPSSPRQGRPRTPSGRVPTADRPLSASQEGTNPTHRLTGQSSQETYDQFEEPLPSPQHGETIPLRPVPHYMRSINKGRK